MHKVAQCLHREIGVQLAQVGIPVSHGGYRTAYRTTFSRDAWIHPYNVPFLRMIVMGGDTLYSIQVRL